MYILFDRTLIGNDKCSFVVNNKISYMYRIYSKVRSLYSCVHIRSIYKSTYIHLHRRYNFCQLVRFVASFARVAIYIHIYMYKFVYDCMRMRMIFCFCFCSFFRYFFLFVIFAMTELKRVNKIHNNNTKNKNSIVKCAKQQ